MFAVICPITSTERNLPTLFSLPKELDTIGQVLISQLKSLDFKERKLKKLMLCLYKTWLKSIKLSNISFNHSNEPLAELKTERQLPRQRRFQEPQPKAIQNQG